jgi:acyl-CoA thioesterase FadM
MLETTVAIRADDLDRRGFVSSTAYLTYLEELFARGLDEVLGQNWVTIRVELERGVDLVQADGEARAEAWLERTGRSSLSFRVAIRRGDGTVAVSGRVVLVAWDPRTRRSRVLDSGEIESLRIAASPPAG